MEYFSGSDRILYVKYLGAWMPVGCLTSNSLTENAEMLSTTTRDNNGWSTSRPTMQSYTISFEGIQINTTMSGGTFSVASYDRLKLLKRSKTLLDWKIQGATFPTVDYGKCYITDISEASEAEGLLTFSGTLTGYGLPKTASLNQYVLNDGDPDVILTTDTTATLIIKTTD